MIVDKNFTAFMSLMSKTLPYLGFFSREKKILDHHSLQIWMEKKISRLVSKKPLPTEICSKIHQAPSIYVKRTNCEKGYLCSDYRGYRCSLASFFKIYLQRNFSLVPGYRSGIDICTENRTRTKVVSVPPPPPSPWKICSRVPVPTVRYRTNGEQQLYSTYRI